jgi:hypothetical protein
MPHSSRFAPRMNVTLRVTGGKNGKFAARNGTEVARFGKVGGKNGKVLHDAATLHAREPALALAKGWRVCRAMRLFSRRQRGVALCLLN